MTKLSLSRRLLAAALDAAGDHLAETEEAPSPGGVLAVAAIGVGGILTYDAIVRLRRELASLGTFRESANRALDQLQREQKNEGLAIEFLAQRVRALEEMSPARRDPEAPQAGQYRVNLGDGEIARLEEDARGFVAHIVNRHGRAVANLSAAAVVAGWPTMLDLAPVLERAPALHPIAPVALRQCRANVKGEVVRIDGEAPDGLAFLVQNIVGPEASSRMNEKDIVARYPIALRGSVRAVEGTT